MKTLEILNLDCGMFPAPASLTAAMRIARKRRDGDLDRRFKCGRKILAYVARENARCTRLYLKRRVYRPAEYQA